ncbi:type IV pilin protein [Rhodoferax aquaticus]|uniref:Type IV pilin protein n=1 Tax=Rhodoferax aquaticus TaxID=2527691 RepID=A0A515ENJ7_9BURK|nr:type IV pilin protein [Rhodoferax aquaticus]QDL54232.1 type IV pilin protein [Rhodoferax aquaticus]
MKKRNRGFSLIELMITVAIISIVAMIALPNYQEHIIKTRRVLAKACLVELGQLMERQYTTTMSYAAAVLPGTTCTQDLSATYTFAFANAPTATTFIINATPKGAQSGDTQCGTMGLNQVGARSASGSKTVKECWK